MKARLVRLFVLFGIIICVSSSAFPAEKQKKISITPLWKGKKEVKLTHLNTIGSADFEVDEGAFFALIMDMQCDRQGNLFVLDDKMRNLREYSPKGTLLNEFKLNKGKGPGDFVEPDSFAIDAKGNFYITDRWARVTVFDREFNFQRVLKIPGTLNDIAVSPDNNLYITKFRRPEMDKVFKYSSLDGSLLKTFCTGLKDKKIRTANVGYLSTDTNGNLIYSFWYPNDIKKFSRNEKLNLYFSRKAKMKIAVPSTITNGVDFQSVTMGSAVFPDGKILNVIRNWLGGSRYQFWFDIYSKDGVWLISFSGEDVKNPFVRCFTIDPFGNLYLDYMYPNPHIRKYKIEFIDKS